MNSQITLRSFRAAAGQLLLLFMALTVPAQTAMADSLAVVIEDSSAVPPDSSAIAAEVLPDTTGNAMLDAYIRKHRRRAEIPGIAVGVVRNGQIAFLRAYGEAAPGKPVTEQSAFMLGSISKSFTAAAVVQLQEAGKIDLDAPVKRYLPFFELKSRGVAETITVRNLLHHQSGLPQSASYIGESSGRSLKERVATLAEVEVSAPPGRKFQYANINYAILGLLVETVSGMPYAEYLRRNIWQPLDMQNSNAGFDSLNADEIASGYRYWFGIPREAGIDYPADNMPSGHLVASAADMCNYLIAQMNAGTNQEKSLLSPAGLRQLHLPAEGEFYAMGWIRGQINGIPAIFHGGSLANYEALMALMPDNNSGVIVLININSFILRSQVRRISENIVSVAAGHWPPAGEWSISDIYRIINALVLVWLFFVLRSLVAFVRQARLAHVPDEKRRPAWKIILQDIVPSAIVLPGVPLYLGISWPAIFTGQPDITLVILIMIILPLILSLLKLLVFRRQFIS